MAAAKDPSRAVLLSASYVLLSSLFGLLLGVLLHPLFFFIIWGQSLLADLVFVLGSLLGLGFGVVLAEARHYAISALVAFVVAWTTYAASFTLLGRDPFRADAFGDEAFAAGPAEIWMLVFRVGWVGLVFAGAAPAVWVARSRARAAAPVAPATVS